MIYILWLIFSPSLVTSGKHAMAMCCVHCRPDMSVISVYWITNNNDKIIIYWWIGIIFWRHMHHMPSTLCSRSLCAAHLHRNAKYVHDRKHDQFTLSFLHVRRSKYFTATIIDEADWFWGKIEFYSCALRAAIASERENWVCQMVSNFWILCSSLLDNWAIVDRLYSQIELLHSSQNDM